MGVEKGVVRLLTQGRPRVLDGGMGSLLSTGRAGLEKDPLWGARLLLDDPEAVKEAHRTYLRAGAEVLTTNSYQAALPTLTAAVGSQEAAEKVLRSSVRLAREAASPSSALVAASIGPYAVLLADGSEYSGAYIETASRADVVAYHRNQARALLLEKPDFLAFETVPSLGEARLILEALRSLDGGLPPVWVSFCCRDGARLAHGESFKEASEVLASSGQVAGVGINCTAPRHVEALLASAAGCALPFLVYPNSGEDWAPNIGFQGESQASVEFLTSAVPRWAALGATAIGGCCQLGPDSIRTIADVIRRL